MLNGEITDDQARALAALVHQLRPTWDFAGIRVAIHEARHLAPAHELAIAAVRVAMDGLAKTPAVLGLAGPHWRDLEAAAPRVAARTAKCPLHPHRPAEDCGECRAEYLVDAVWPTGTLHRDAHRPTHTQVTDHAMAAANDREDHR